VIRYNPTTLVLQITHGPYHLRTTRGFAQGTRHLSRAHKGTGVISLVADTTRSKVEAEQGYRGERGRPQGSGVHASGAYENESAHEGRADGGIRSEKGGQAFAGLFVACPNGQDGGAGGADGMFRSFSLGKIRRGRI
jgi:hypothetical protein